MVVAVVLPSSPLVGAGFVLASIVARLKIAESVFVLLSTDVFEAKRLLWHVRHAVFVVSDPPEVSHLSSGEGREARVTYTRRAVVIALDIRVSLGKVHGCKRGQSCAKTVASRLHSCRRILDF